MISPGFIVMHVFLWNKNKGDDYEHHLPCEIKN